MTDLLLWLAVRNSQLALSVVNNNIANVNTDGYVRQDLDLQEGLPTKNGLFYWQWQSLMVCAGLMTVKWSHHCALALAI